MNSGNGGHNLMQGNVKIGVVTAILTAAVTFAVTYGSNKTEQEIRLQHAEQNIEELKLSDKEQKKKSDERWEKVLTELSEIKAMLPKQ